MLAACTPSSRTRKALMSNSVELNGRMDSRSRRSRALLAEALLSLGARGADIDALEVGELAREAGVSRSTFYQHFASKDDFLIGSFVQMIEAIEKAHAARFPDRSDVLPSRALFAHVSTAQGLVRSVVRSEIYMHQMAAGEAKLRSIAENNLRRLRPAWGGDQRREAAVYIAGGFIGLLRWWMEAGLKQSPERLQAAFERLTERALAEAEP